MIHAVTNDNWEQKRLAAFSKKLLPWVDRIHLREKRYSEKETDSLVETFLKSGIPPNRLIVHHFPEIAHKYRLYGVHLPEHMEGIPELKRSFPGLRIGQSVHSAGAAQQAEEAGADYLYYGHVFLSDSKPGHAPRGLAELKALVRSAAIPVIAIGGIHAENAADVLQTGAAGIAAISAFFPPDESLEEASKLSILRR